MRPIFLHRYNLYIYISDLDYIYLSKYISRFVIRKYRNNGNKFINIIFLSLYNTMI